MKAGSNVRINIIQDKIFGSWRFLCVECPEFHGTTDQDSEAIQNSLDHYHLYHPQAIMAFTMQ